MPRNLAVTATRLSGGSESTPRPVAAECDLATRCVYVAALEALRRADVEFMIGGAYALTPYAGVIRDTKDLDVFLRRADCEAAQSTLGAAGFRTELTFPHWLAKAHAPDGCIDLIFGAGNGVAMVDDLWFEHAIPDKVFGVPVLLCPPEEMIWSKAFIMERERYDGADVAHLILACGPTLDWRRLLRRFGRRWRVLLSHLVLFGFIYPGERAAIPDWVMAHLLRRLDRDRRGWSGKAPRVCDGTLLSRKQYLVDITEGGFADGRLAPRGEMTADDIALWTAAIAAEESAPGSSVLHPNGRLGSRARRRRR